MNRKIYIILFCFLFLSFCSKRDKAAYKIENIDGIKVVHNFIIDPAESFKGLVFIEDLSIGIEEGDENYMLNTPVDIDLPPINVLHAKLIYAVEDAKKRLSGLRSQIP